jgi:hypothetical protein
MYRISLPNQKEGVKTFISFLIALLNMLSFAYALYFSRPASEVLGFGFAISVGAFIFFLVKYYTRFLQSFVLEISFVLCAITWLIYGNIILGLLLGASAVFGLVAKKEAVILIDDMVVTLPSFPEKKIRWEEIDFVKIKDGILTIELKNNHLIQHTLEPKVAGKINEEEFNQFCNQQTIARQVAGNQ